MSNVCLLQTKVVNSPAAHETNTVVQNKMIFKVYRMSFPDRTKLIFGGSTTDLSKAKLDEPQGNLIYKGDAAIRKLKELGLEAPDDADLNKGSKRK